MNSINNILSQKADDLFKQDEELNLVLATSTTEVDTTNSSAPTEEVDLDKLKNMLYSLKDQIDGILRLVEGKQIKIRQKNSEDKSEQILQTGERIIEGVFNGEKMVGSDGKEYSIPPNYASKSKLVEGDMMKLTITNNGSFIFKQIGPIERKRLVGELVGSENDQWSVLSEGKTYKILTASVTFYKGKAGDEVVILIPEEGSSAWGAVDNIIHPNT